VVAYVRGAASWMGERFPAAAEDRIAADFNNLRNVLPRYQSKFQGSMPPSAATTSCSGLHPAEFPGKDVGAGLLPAAGILSTPRKSSSTTKACRRRLGLLYLYRHQGKQGNLSSNAAGHPTFTRQLGALQGDKMRLAGTAQSPISNWLRRTWRGWKRAWAARSRPAAEARRTGQRGRPAAAHATRAGVAAANTGDALLPRPPMRK